MTKPKPTRLQFEYKNWKGEVSMRTVIPFKIWWGKTGWHPEYQWFLRAFDVDKKQDRDFAMLDIKGIAPEGQLNKENSFKPKWQPIKDAPKDGTRLILKTAIGNLSPCEWSPAGEISEDGFWLWWLVGPEYFATVKEPSHFMPFPEETER